MRKGPLGFNGFSEVLERIYSVVDTREFARNAVEALREAIPGAVLAIDEIDHAAGEMRSELSVPLPAKNPAEYRMRAVQNLAREHPVFQYLQAGGTERIFQLSDWISQPDLRDTQLFEENYRPFGASYEIATVDFTASAMLALVFVRDRDFTGPELDFVRLLSPHIKRAHANAQQFTALKNGQLQYRAFAPEKLLALKLTPREAEVAHWLLLGKRDREIAVILGASPRTVEKHVQKILEKLGVETRSAAVSQLVAQAC